MDALQAEENSQSTSGDGEVTESEIAQREGNIEDNALLINPHHNPMDSKEVGAVGELSDTCEFIFCQVPHILLIPNPGRSEKNLGRTKDRELYFHEYLELGSQQNVAWSTTHAFFVVVGDFHYYADGEPFHPLPPTGVLELVKLGALVLPTSNELKDKTKKTPFRRVFPFCSALRGCSSTQCQ